MRITLLVVGRTDQPYLITGIQEYVKRLQHYVAFKVVEIAGVKRSGPRPEQLIREQEGREIRKFLSPNDSVVLLDERGQQYTSVQFADFLQGNMNSGVKHLVFVIGGAFGFADDIQQLARMQVSLSEMTFSHQMIRLFFVEQLYRAMTILRNEKYHHEG